MKEIENCNINSAEGKRKQPPADLEIDERMYFSTIGCNDGLATFQPCGRLWQRPLLAVWSMVSILRFRLVHQHTSANRTRVPRAQRRNSKVQYFNPGFLTLQASQGYLMGFIITVAEDTVSMRCIWIASPYPDKSKSQRKRRRSWQMSSLQ